MMMAASSMWAGWDPVWEPSVRVIRIVPLLIQSGPVGTIAIPADLRRLVGVSLFLEGGGEVCIDGVPATVYVYGVGCR